MFTARTFSLCLLFLVIRFALLSSHPPPADAKTYVGSDACKDCHEDEYGKFMQYAKKAHSYDHIIRMKRA